MSANPYLGDLMLFGGNFAPRGWMDCNGQLLAISSNTALFSLLGTIYGGDGRTTFALPDLRGRLPIAAGNGPGLTSRSQGQKAGQELHTLSLNEMGSHSHTITAADADATTEDPDGNLFATSTDPLYRSGPGAGTLAAGAAGSSGGDQAHENRMPSITLRWVICVQGQFPSRN
ncbi:phage tail protein [Euzebya pacifica]|nr:tail fiber protein [Euzebya pacifica]